MFSRTREEKKKKKEKDKESSDKDKKGKEGDHSNTHKRDNSTSDKKGKKDEKKDDKKIEKKKRFSLSIHKDRSKKSHSYTQAVISDQAPPNSAPARSHTTGFSLQLPQHEAFQRGRVVNTVRQPLEEPPALTTEPSPRTGQHRHIPHVPHPLPPTPRTPRPDFSDSNDTTPTTTNSPQLPAGPKPEITESGRKKTFNGHLSVRKRTIRARPTVSQHVPSPLPPTPEQEATQQPQEPQQQEQQQQETTEPGALSGSTTSLPTLPTSPTQPRWVGSNSMRASPRRDEAPQQQQHHHQLGAIEEQGDEGMAVKFEEILPVTKEEVKTRPRANLRGSFGTIRRNSGRLTLSSSLSSSSSSSSPLSSSSESSSSSHWGMRSQKKRGVARDAAKKEKLEKDAVVIVDALRKREKEKEEQYAEETKRAAEALKESGDNATTATPIPPPAPPPPPIAPPPPPPEKVRVNMLGSNSEDYYMNLFGVSKNVLETQSGLYKWRIEQMQPVLIPPTADGQHQMHQFYEKDCYLLLWVDAVLPEKDSEAADATGVIGSQVSTYNLHYWMGKDTSSDKMGTVCVRAVQLNTFLSGLARHYPETQGEESPLFVSYFNGQSLEYMAGGTESPFRKVEQITEYKEGPRLYRFFLIGDEMQRRMGKYFQMQRVEFSSHWFKDPKYKSDVFLLDTGLNIFQWNGVDSLGNFQFNCNDIALAMRTERQSKPTVHILEEAKEESKDSIFWDYVNKAPNKADSAEVEAVYPIRLHCIKGTTGEDIDESLVWSSEKDKSSCLPSKKFLLSSNVYILDAHAEIYVWYGKKSTNYCRQIALLIASKMLSDEDVHRPPWAVVEETKESTEHVLFKAHFSDWTDSSEVVKKRDFRSAHEVILDQIRKRGALSADMFLPHVNPASLFPEAKKAVNAKTDSGVSGEAHAKKEERGPVPGSVEVGILDSGKTFRKIPEEEMGQFFSGDSYIILYHTDVTEDEEEEEEKQKQQQQQPIDPTAPKKQKWIIYFWEGKDSSPLRWPTFQLGLFPILQENIVKSGSAKPKKIKVFQEREPEEFMRLFEDMIVVSRGSRKAALDRAHKRNQLALQPVEDVEGDKPKKHENLGQVVMYRSIHSPEDDVTRMIEVLVTKRSLDPHGTFLLHTPEKVFIWHGKEATLQTRESVKKYIDLGDADKEEEGGEEGKGKEKEEGKEKEKEKESENEDEGDGAKGPKIVSLEDGNEPEDFWYWLNYFGGDDEDEGAAVEGDSKKLNKSLGGSSKVVGDRTKARLVSFTYEAGNFAAREIIGFTQNDLQCSQAYLLDSFMDGGHIFLWLGKSITDGLLNAARHVTKLYVQYVAKKQECNKRKPLEEVKEGEESSAFTKYFTDWTRAVFIDPYEKRLQELKEEEERQRKLKNEEYMALIGIPYDTLEVMAEELQAEYLYVTFYPQLLSWTEVYMKEKEEADRLRKQELIEEAKREAVLRREERKRKESEEERKRKQEEREKENQLEEERETERKIDSKEIEEKRDEGEDNSTTPIESPRENIEEGQKVEVDEEQSKQELHAVEEHQPGEKEESEPERKEQGIEVNEAEEKEQEEREREERERAEREQEQKEREREEREREERERAEREQEEKEREREREKEERERAEREQEEKEREREREREREKEREGEEERKGEGEEAQNVEEKEPTEKVQQEPYPNPLSGPDNEGLHAGVKIGLVEHQSPSSEEKRTEENEVEGHNSLSAEETDSDSTNSSGDEQDEGEGKKGDEKTTQESSEQEEKKTIEEQQAVESKEDTVPLQPLEEAPKNAVEETSNSTEEQDSTEETSESPTETKPEESKLEETKESDDKDTLPVEQTAVHDVSDVEIVEDLEDNTGEATAEERKEETNPVVEDHNVKDVKDEKGETAEIEHVEERESHVDGTVREREDGCNNTEKTTEEAKEEGHHVDASSLNAGDTVDTTEDRVEIDSKEQPSLEEGRPEIEEHVPDHKEEVEEASERQKVEETTTAPQQTETTVGGEEEVATSSTVVISQNENDEEGKGLEPEQLAPSNKEEEQTVGREVGDSEDNPKEEAEQSREEENVPETKVEDSHTSADTADTTETVEDKQPPTQDREDKIEEVVETTADHKQEPATETQQGESSEVAIGMEDKKEGEHDIAKEDSHKVEEQPTPDAIVEERVEVVDSETEDTEKPSNAASSDTEEGIHNEGQGVHVPPIEERGTEEKVDGTTNRIEDVVEQIDGVETTEGEMHQSETKKIEKEAEDFLTRSFDSVITQVKVMVDRELDSYNEENQQPTASEETKEIDSKSEDTVQSVEREIAIVVAEEDGPGKEKKEETAEGEQQDVAIDVEGKKEDAQEGDPVLERLKVSLESQRKKSEEKLAMLEALKKEKELEQQIIELEEMRRISRERLKMLEMHKLQVIESASPRPEERNEEKEEKEKGKGKDKEKKKKKKTTSVRKKKVHKEKEEKDKKEVKGRKRAFTISTPTPTAESPPSSSSSDKEKKKKKKDQGSLSARGSPSPSIPSAGSNIKSSTPKESSSVREKRIKKKDK